MATLRYPAALCLGALLAIGCQDPAPTTGSLIVQVTGLPTNATGSVRVSGPNQFFQLVSATMTLENLVPGEYIIDRDTVLFQTTRYGVALVRDTVTVARGRTESSAVAYQIASGSLTVMITGLPAGVAADVRVRGPLNAATFVVVSTSGTITGLRPGQYEIQSGPMIGPLGDRFSAALTSQIVSVPASLIAVEATVLYQLASGTLSLTVTGLPASSPTQPIEVTGPGGFQARAAQSTVFRGLAAGTYSIVAANVNGACPDIFTATDGPQSREVLVGQTSNASVTYTQSAVSSANLNLRIDQVYLTQASQNYEGTVPLLSGKPALLRVFGVANQCNTARPSVRVTLSTGPTYEITATEDSVRTATDESRLASSWNVVVPGSAVQVGMTVVAEMDFTGVAAEASEGDNRFPATGVKPIDVRTAPVVGLRFVPVAQTVNNVVLTGNVTGANVDLFMDWPRKLFPVGTFDVDIRDTYTTSAAALQANNGSTWSQVLSEIRTLQQSEGSQRYYYGVARTSYNSGIAGIAYVPGKTGLGWDFVSANTSNNSGSRVLAHELGHNLGRFHSPCGVSEGVDQGYPTTGLYVGGKIGAFGWDPFEGLKGATAFSDVMGYCNAQWISDYTYLGILNWLTDRPPSLPTISSNNLQPSLLVWGRIENGVPILEPTFEISARPQPPAPGPHRISATDASGAEIFSVSFAGERIADLPGEHESFAFTVPLSALRGRELAALALTARGRTVRSVPSADVASDPTVVATRAGAGAMRVRWDASRFPVVMVRNPVNGQVLSFARGGDATIVTSRTELELNFSNRVRSSRRLTQFK